jgi:hypothetical protein
VGRRGKHRILELTPELAGRLGIGEDGLLEMLGKNPAPLRAWARIRKYSGNGGTHQGGHLSSIRLDPFARQVLGIAAGDLVELRPLPAIHVPGGLAY